MTTRGTPAVEGPGGSAPGGTALSDPVFTGPVTGPTGTAIEFGGPGASPVEWSDTRDPAARARDEGLYLPMWLRDKPQLAQIYIDAWVETGDPLLALDAVRSAPGYDDFFPGNRREDGTLIHDETTYQSVVESYEDVLLSVNLNPDLFTNRFGALIQGLVSPQEFATRVDTAYEGIIDQAPEIARWYADHGFADGITTEAIVASVLDPDLGELILAGDISMAQVGGQASRRGFDFGIEFARQLTQAGLDTSSEASQFFALAEGSLPVMNTLAKRHLDPDDDFDLNEFTQATLFEDPEQRRRMRRLIAQERASFTSGPAGIGSLARSRSGGLMGLEAQ